jgi:hypothetical protein
MENFQLRRQKRRNSYFRPVSRGFRVFQRIVEFRKNSRSRGPVLRRAQCELMAQGRTFSLARYRDLAKSCQTAPLFPSLPVRILADTQHFTPARIGDRARWRRHPRQPSARYFNSHGGNVPPEAFRLARRRVICASGSRGRFRDRKTFDRGTKHGEEPPSPDDARG